jgi:hypothetical protein
MHHAQLVNPFADPILRIAPLTVAARLSGRALWQARYRFHNEVDERACGWEEAPKIGMQELRLVCPNGEIAVLGNRQLNGEAGDISERSFHVGQAQRGTGGHERWLDLIGIVTGPGDQCTCYAWDYPLGQLVGKPAGFVDHFSAMQAGHIFPLGKLDPYVLGVKF